MQRAPNERAGPTVLVFCSPADAAALWAANGLRQRLGPGVKTIADEALACALRWEHRVGEAGASVEALLADGERISSLDVDGVLNRLAVVPPTRFAGAAPAEREYALQEAHAFFLSWLHCLPAPVIPQPSPHALSGHPRSDLEWELLASRAGLRTEERHWTSDDGVARPAHGGVETAIVFDGRVFGSRLPAAELEACVALAGAAESELLAVVLRRRADHWCFARATEWADLRLGGAPLLDALASRLSTSRRSH